MFLTIFSGNEAPWTVRLEEYGKNRITFGRSKESDIILRSPIVSGKHGAFILKQGDWSIQDNHSTNGLILNGQPIGERILSDGLKIYIGSETHSEKVVFFCSAAVTEDVHESFSLASCEKITIGRDPACSLCLSHVGVSRVHAKIQRGQDGYYLKAEGNSEVRCNGMSMGSQAQKLSDMDRFMIGDTQFLYRGGELFYQRQKDGLSLEVSHLFKIVSSGKKEKTITNDVSLRILAGEFVAIIGGSGAGKSTLLKCMSGCSSISRGTVLLQGEDIQSGYESLKTLMGYVPQQDIVYDNLTLGRMLCYSAQLRMPRDSSRQDIRARIRQVLDTVELTGHENTMIRSLSGGQKKRASIAVELMSDPGIFFLDEPTSGLDPGTEQNLMKTLKAMTEHGKTVILVTHTPLNLDLCDKIIMMGPGGRLCFCGGPARAREFFGVENFADMYNLVQKDAAGWEERCAACNPTFPISYPAPAKEKQKAAARVLPLTQLRVLSARYLEMIWNDRRKSMLQLMMAPGLGLLLYLAFSKSLHPFQVSFDTQSFALALACCGFWIGLFQSIQEICKERTIVEREKMAALCTGAYLGSKILVLGGILLLQSALLLGVVWLLIGHPQQGMVFASAFLEYLLTTYLTALSAASMGLLVSALVGSTDQAVSIAPLLLIPQILFSEIICPLYGAAAAFASLVSCRWACLAYGASANINSLPGEYGESGSALWRSGSEVDGFVHARYDFHEPLSALSNPSQKSWALLLLLILMFTAIAAVALKKRREL